MKVLIFGVNGFIGHHLTKEGFSTQPTGPYMGMDLGFDRLGKSLDNPPFSLSGRGLYPSIRNG